MHVLAFLMHHLVAAAGVWWLLLPIIIFGTIALEDVTIALVGILAADHLVPIPSGLIALILGIIAGDSLAFLVGRLAVRHPFARRIIEHDRIVPVRALLQDNARITVFITRFMPGFRMALYSACGFFAVPFRRFLPVSILSAIVWTTLLFTLSFWYGFYTIHELGFWRWPVLALILSGFFLFGHRYWKKVTTVQAEPA